MPAIDMQLSMFTSRRPQPRPELIEPGSPLYSMLCHPAAMVYSMPAFLYPLLSPETAESTFRIDAIFQEDADLWTLARRLRDTGEMVLGPVYARRESDHVAYALRELHRNIAGTLPDGTPYHSWNRAVWTWNWAAIASALMSSYGDLRGYPSDSFRDQVYAGMVELGRRFGVVGMPDTYQEFAAMWPAERERFAEATTPAVQRLARLITPDGLPPPSQLKWLPNSVWRLLSSPIRHWLRVSILVGMPQRYTQELEAGRRFDSVVLGAHRLLWQIVPRRAGEAMGRTYFALRIRYGTPVWRTRFSAANLSARPQQIEQTACPAASHL